MSKETRGRTVIVGLGKTGLSVARYLIARGEDVIVADTRQSPPGLSALRKLDAAVPVFAGPFDPALFLHARRLVVSPGVALHEPAITRARERVEVIGDIELFARAAQAPVVAITGSNGKSTVTALIGEMIAGSGRRVLLGGNYGPPVLDLLDAPRPDFYVLELSSFQLETVDSLRPAVATVLNVSSDHMDRYPDLATYASTKARIFRGASVRIVNRDDPIVHCMTPPNEAVSFGSDTPPAGHYGLVQRSGEWWLVRGQDRYLREGELRIAGRHNTLNALAALALGDAIGLDRAAMLDALRRFPGLAHRCQWVGTGNEVRWYNDSKGTNVGATLAALRGMPGRILLIAGGVGKGADFRPLATVVAQKARAVVLFGRDADQIAAALEGAAEIACVPDLGAAVAAAKALARPGDRVLLSPACASFDMFRDYEHRGEVFMDLVREAIG